ncbi:Serine/threonine-protein kinase tel1 [Elasticomyces elasticus]|nr:Serine/threonine-protein kinase tel1 [Elasticomyces elasticus]
MSGESTLIDAFDQIEQGGMVARKEGLKELTTILRHNLRSPGAVALEEKTFQWIYERLYGIVLTEKATWLSAKTAKGAAEERLSLATTALRFSVELDVRNITSPTVKAIIRHVLDTISLPGGELCVPIALDYARCLKIIFSYQPHVEHLSTEGWDRAVLFCVHHLRTTGTNANGSDTRSGAERTSRLGLTNSTSSRSARSQATDSSGSQRSRTVVKQVSDELIACLSLLTAVPNVQLARHADTCLWTLIDLLKVRPTPGNGHQNAFAVINHVLLWARTDDVGLTKKATTQLVRLIRHFWSTNNTALKDEMLIALLYLQPYMKLLMLGESALPLRSELLSLAETLRADYGKRKESSQLQMNEVRLALSRATLGGSAQIKSAVLELRSGAGLRAEHNWGLLCTLATLDTLLCGPQIDGGSSEEEDEKEDDLQQRPRKRRRVADDYEGVLTSTSSGSVISRVASLHVATFILQDRLHSAPHLCTTIDTLLLSCGDDDTNVASWALLALTSCASQSTSTAEPVASRWVSVWYVACRLLSNISTCRAACHLIDIILRLDLVAQPIVTEFLQSIATSMQSSGPAIIADSSTHLLNTIQKISQRLSPGKTVALAESTISWLCRHYLATTHDDKTHATSLNQSQPRDVTQLIGTCLGLYLPTRDGCAVPRWEEIGQVLVTLRDQQPVVSYLLLLPDQINLKHPQLAKPWTTSTSSASGGTLSCETLLLNQFIPELQKTSDAWRLGEEALQTSARSTTFAFLCHVCCALSAVVHCAEFRDARRQSHRRRQLDELFKSISTFAGGPRGDMDLVDAMLIAVADQADALIDNHAHRVYAPSASERMLCRYVSNALSAQWRTGNIGNADGVADDIDMDLDDSMDSQESRRGKATSSSGHASNDSMVSFSAAALRADVGLYAFVTARWEESQQPPSGQGNSMSAQITDYLVSLPVDDLIAGRRAISTLPRFGIHLEVEDADRFLEYCTDKLLSAYVNERSEVALGTMLAVVLSLLSTVTGSGNQDLFSLGVDIYEWFVKTLTAGVLSVNVQRNVGALLLALCNFDVDYGRDHDVQSARTTLFKLVQGRSIRVQYYLADRISSVFGLFVLSQHDQIFIDLQASLPADTDWIEGIAMRLLFLSRLASAWHSLLRPGVYYMFETAGQVKEAAAYAAWCIQELTKSLGFTSARKLFRLFAPQLLHTWLEHHALSGIPYAAFEYASLDDLIERNQGEIVAQLMMRGKTEVLHILSKALKMPEKDVVKRSYAQAMAYTLAVDAAATNDVEKTCELRLRGLLGLSKDEVRTTARRDFAAIMGHVYLTMQQEDVEDKWLEHNPSYGSAAKALREMKSYSHSTRLLPASQQPSWRSKVLLKLHERICRRAGLDKEQPWSASSFSLTVRMLLNAIDHALGPLHKCLMLRRLRILICTAGEVALSGYPLTMLVHSIRPFLSESQCADDALGMLQYLLHHGGSYLKVEEAMFTTGTVCVTVLQMKAHAAAKQESTTQETQHQQTVHKMEVFQNWLVTYLSQPPSLDDTTREVKLTGLARALGAVQLPGNARKGSAESNLLKILLEDQVSSGVVMSKAHREEALQLLSMGFDVPGSADEDCMNGDATCVRYASSLWHVTRWPAIDPAFLTWAAKVIGRAYASSGLRPSSPPSAADRPLAPDGKPYEGGVLLSQAQIAQRLAELMLSPIRSEAALADWTLRTIFCSFRDPAEALALEQMLPANLVPVVNDGTYSYEPHTVFDRDRVARGERMHLSKALEVAASIDDEAWAQGVTIALCAWASNVPMLSSLSALLRHVPRLATDLLPCIAHIILHGDQTQNQVVRVELSNSLSQHLADRSVVLHARQRLLLRLVLYLRGQPWPGESTKSERSKWLEMDLMGAAEAASRCGMPYAALLFAESSTPAAPVHRRASTRVSMSQTSVPELPDDLLLSIFTQVDEPDSFYAVQQSASLDTVLNRLDYEKNGMKSLMFRSARMDSAMRLSHAAPQSEVHGVLKSLSALNLHSLEFALVSGPMAASASSVDEMMDAARKLQQWDMVSSGTTSSPSSARFSALQQLSRAASRDDAAAKLRTLILNHVQQHSIAGELGMPSSAWFNALASLTEATDVLRSSTEGTMQAQWSLMIDRQQAMCTERPEDASEVATDRSLLFSVLSQNASLMRDLHVSVKSCKAIEVEALLGVARLARSNGGLQEALSAATQLDLVLNDVKDSMGLDFSAASMQETAAVLWDAGEAAASVKMLRAIMNMGNGEQQHIPVGDSGVLASLARQLASARLEKPDQILESYLRPAIKHLKNRSQGHEAGKVFYEFASFCDRQLQHPGNTEDFNRMARLREKKLADVEDLEQMKKGRRQNTTDYQREMSRARKWFEMDDTEYKRLKATRDDFLQQSLQNYLLALHASNDHDICVLRFFAMWLESCGHHAANEIVRKHIDAVPTWKFVVLNNQLMSRLENDKSDFQMLLKSLMQRICADHPHHSLHHLYTATRKPKSNGDTALLSRFEAATGIKKALENHPQKANLVARVFRADAAYDEFAYSSVEGINKTKVECRQFTPATSLITRIRQLHVPPATISLPLRPDGEYGNVPQVQRFEGFMSIMSGLSRPKVLTAIGTDGVVYKQLFKGTENDDMRQDAIMEQVFEEVSKMLRSHKTTRLRDLQVRTYKVIPLSAGSGIMEWVSNSIPIGEWMKVARPKYTPKAPSQNAAGGAIRKVEHDAVAPRLNAYRKICDQMPPIMRHFFFERFDDPDEWFQRRTSYTRTTAAISMLGYIMGLGDRHLQNILLDEVTGEAVHIDLGVAFEAGKVLAIPEKVPFRLSRDLVDAMGVTKTEGIFRRCCEFTMDALREDKDSIMTLLNVLRYDPLYNWSVSPLRAKRMQDAAQGMTGNAGNEEEASSRAKEHEAGEADRALSVVEQKLSKTLSTAATVNELIQQATDEVNLATLFGGWAAFW